MLKISNNSMSIAKGCWKKYYWTYVEGLRPKQKTEQLKLGTVIHTAFELFYTGTSDSDTLDYIKNTYDASISEAYVDDQEKVLTNKYIAMGMWAGYPHKDPKEFEENKVELEFEIGLKSLRGVRVVGRADAIVKKNGVWWVREIKTTGLSPSQFESRLKTSSQATLYTIAARQQGYEVAGVMYDAIKKPLLRKGVHETVDDYGARIVADYIYDGKQPDGQRKYYSRPRTYRTEEDLKMYQEDTKLLVSQLRGHIKSNTWERNTDQCWNFNSECPYAKICFQEVPDKLTIQTYYDKKEKVHV